MMLILGLAVSGMGASGLVNGSFTIIAASAPPERQPCKSAVSTPLVFSSRS
jgi:hypothetical protein